MRTFTIKRFLSGLVLLIGIATASFFMAHVAFHNPTAALLGNDSTKAQQEALGHQLGLDQPVVTQYWHWLSHAVQGDFETSWSQHDSVNSELSAEVPVTMSIVMFGLFLTALLGGIFGLVSGLRPGGVIDRVLKGCSVVLFALPGFWVSILLVTWFAVDLKWFHAVGYTKPQDSFSGWMQSITLPSISLALSGIVSIASQLRNGIVETNSLDFVRTLRSRGLSQRRIALHLLRNASPTGLTVLSLNFVGLLSGAIIVEQIFSLPGIGARTSSAALSGDIPVMLGITVVSVVFVIIVNFVLDLLLGWINPKARLS